ncbi:MAG: ABC transporter ATP-binding protein [Planctomycetota bacterium]
MSAEPRELFRPNDELARRPWLARLRGVSKRYGDPERGFLALRQVDLDLRPGELTLLMGPSGSGKTTLLSVLGCLIRPTGGTVEILDRRVDSLGETELPEIRLRSIGFVFQSFNLLESLTALENIEVPLRLAGAARAEAKTRAAALAERFGIGPKLGQLPRDLSGGEQQRVAIARALALEPAVVLADEPTGALDSKTGRDVIRLLAAYAHLGHAALVVTHDLRIEDLADRVVHLEDGRLAGSPGA